jgi:hypothetical protein
MRFSRYRSLFAAAVIVACASGQPLLADDPTRARAELRTLAAGVEEQQIEFAAGALAAMEGVGSEEVRQAADVSRTGASVTGRVAAVQVLQSWLQRPELQQDVTDELLRTATSENDELVRGLAIQAIAVSDPRPGEEMVRVLGEIVDGDRVTPNRSLAALALGHVKGPLAPRAFRALVAAFDDEQDLGTRRTILLEMMRVSGDDAESMLSRLDVGDEPLLVQDRRDYLEIIATGVRDADAIYDIKQLRDVERNTVIGMETHSVHE